MKRLSLSKPRVLRKRSESSSIKQNSVPDNSYEVLIKSIPLAYFYLIVLSFIGNQGYYEIFRIDITHYMSLQELATSPLDDWSDLIASLVLILSYGLLISILLGTIDLYITLINRKKSPLNLSRFLDHFVNQKPIVLIASALLITAINIRNRFDNFSFLDPQQFIYLSSVVFSFSAYAINRWLVKFNTLSKTSSLTLVAYILLHAYYFIKYDEGSKLLSGTKTAQTINIIKQKGPLTNLQLIGESTSHIFTFQISDSTTHVFKKTDISEIIYLGQKNTRK